MLANGLTLMVIGMGTVFLFLIIMVLVMKFVAYAISRLNKIFPEPKEEEKIGLVRKMDGNQEIAIAIAAVKAYLKQ